MRTASEVRSASEYTATLAMPASFSPRRMRTAISPRFDTSTLRNMKAIVAGPYRANALPQCYDSRPPPARFRGSIAEGRNERRPFQDVAHNLPLHPDSAPVNDPYRLKPHVVGFDE